MRPASPFKTKPVGAAPRGRPALEAGTADAHGRPQGAAPTARGYDPCAHGRPQGAAPTARGHDPCARAARDRRGFTLVELLVALTIFVTVMASVALVFNGAIRTSKQGFQNQEAYELARGTMKVLERDLSRAFTNRDHGDNFNFYGTPIGFTFVGLISADESSAPNMARVTYVMYHDTFQGQAVAVAEYEAKEGGVIPTYHLLRYIEPGADSLDSFPVPWTEFIDQDDLNIRLQDVVDQRVANSDCPDLGCEALVAQAAQREIWIKMLSGGYPGDPNDITASPIPSAWTDLPYFVDRGLDPAHYVVGENIRFLSLASVDSFNVNVRYCAADLPALEVVLANNGVTLDFDDIHYQDGTQTCARIVSNPVEAPLFHDNLNSIFSTAVFSSVQGARPFFTYWDIGIIPNLPNTTADDQHTPVPFQFWNDWRNLAADGMDNDGDNNGPDIDHDGIPDDMNHDGLDNDNDGVADDGDEGIDEPDEMYAESAGSPLNTRLPIAVTTDFTLFFRSPYPGAPDFNERFTQRIDLPTAYRRTIKNTVPVTP